MLCRIVGTVEKIVKICFNFPFPHFQKGLRESWKLCLNLWSLRWLKPSLIGVRSFIPLGLWQLNMLLEDGLKNNRTPFLKFSIVSEILRLRFICSTQSMSKEKNYTWKSRVSQFLLKFYCIALFCNTYCV